jgi:hypothetical protein
MNFNEPPPVLQFQSQSNESRRNSQRESMSEDPELDDRTSLVDGVAFLSLCASGTTDPTIEPHYLGSSSGATIARMIQSSVFRSSGRETASHRRATVADQSPGPRTPPEAFLSPHLADAGTEFPDRQQALMLFEVFFERIHTRWPLLDRLVYTRLFENQYTQGTLSIIERSILHLIYAITARFLSLTKKPCDVDPEV